jgi:hypothetical protein
MLIPSYLVVHRGTNNVTLRNPVTFNDSGNHLTILAKVAPYSTYSSSLDLSYPPNLDDFARKVGLLLASFYSNSNNETLTNKTKLVVGNGTSAYLFQSEVATSNPINNQGQKLLYHSYYLMLSDNLVLPLIRPDSYQ